MRAGIIGKGVVTPRGQSVEEIWKQIGSEDMLQATEQNDAIARASVKTSPLPRLRRSSTISHIALAAAEEAAASSGISRDELAQAALLFATSDGGVIYTRRFQDDVISRGPGAGSPLLFPETVYNAPASHIAASLGMTGEVLTIVGDATAGLTALHTACELLETGRMKLCLVVAAQEADWVSAEAYKRRSLIDVLAEGAAALLLSREAGSTTIAWSHPGLAYRTNADAERRLRQIFEEVPATLSPDLIVSSAGRNPLGAIEVKTCRETFQNAKILPVKPFLGEAFAATTLQQLAIADHALALGAAGSVLVLCTGYNGLLAAAILTRGDSRPQDRSLSWKEASTTIISPDRHEH